MKKKNYKKIILIIAAILAALAGNSFREYTAGETVSYTFRNERLRLEHYEKHGAEMGFSSPEAYEEAACRVVNDSRALNKTEAEDGDLVYYLEATNEFVIVSTDGYIRTYYNPRDGIDYFNRQ